jgi:hypothetical protein
VKGLNEHDISGHVGPGMSGLPLKPIPSALKALVPHVCWNPSASGALIPSGFSVPEDALGPTFPYQVRNNHEIWVNRVYRAQSYALQLVLLSLLSVVE